MTVTRIASLSVTLLALVALTACGNTIRGVGNDVGNVIDATQDAGRSVARSAR
ncbi:entericidin [Peteryoungia ipomoeae]|uniref:Entericidin n=1 Tax=Peteryoungia ipomoeae TaxID=1210932 RepID=A0A4S8P8E4_9HYPH|nr:entericidin [Peteryoungia ipomoeae]THV25132.1 entericidin [Peteryoungia ipomoeae]